MRIAHFAVGDDVEFGVLDADQVVVVHGHPFGPVALTDRRHALADVRLLAPVLPSKIGCVGKNYAEHAREIGGDLPASPVLFLKPSTSVIGPGEPIARPTTSARVDFEGELAVVIGRLCRDVPIERAYDVVLGYTCANDVTARDWQHSDGQWTRAKSCDTFCPLGPWIETALDPADLAITTTLGGARKQHARTSQMRHDVAALIAYITTTMTLLPGDVVLTGTPAGVAGMQPGQRVSVTIEGIGTLTNSVVAK